jgi:hypothetical protein
MDAGVAVSMRVAGRPIASADHFPFMADHSKRTAPAVEAHYQFLLWLLPAIDRFPRAQKFVFGDRIVNLGLDVLESLVEATFRRRAHA